MAFTDGAHYSVETVFYKGVIVFLRVKIAPC
jgi:hypothetical protein